MMRREGPSPAWAPAPERRAAASIAAMIFLFILPSKIFINLNMQI
jgi:hypothetical protein